jgi:hypothetical protein
LSLAQVYMTGSPSTRASPVVNGISVPEAWFQVAAPPSGLGSIPAGLGAENATIMRVRAVRNVTSRQFTLLLAALRA